MNQVAMQLENLPQDLIVEILRRLSFKDILKNKCICKSWQALFSNPVLLQYLRQLLLNHKQPALNPNRRLLVFGDYLAPYDDGITTDRKTMLHVYNERSVTLKLAFEDKIGEKVFTNVMSSSLLEFVLLCNSRSQFVRLHNPSTDEFFDLPKSFDDKDFKDIFIMGLGQVESTKKYKVVRFVQCSSQYVSEVFTLGIDDHWRKVADPPIAVHSRKSIFAEDGGLYWFDSEECYKELLRFDIEREEWMMIPGPEQSRCCFYYWIIQEVDGFVCITYNCSSTIYMWVLKDYEQGIWGPEISIDIDYNFRRICRYAQLYPISFNYGDGKILFVSNEEYPTTCLNTSKLLSYDPITLHVEQLPNPYPTIDDITATFFIESFEPLF